MSMSAKQEKREQNMAMMMLDNYIAESPG